MNEQLAKEARRNLRKEMGATATDAMERARHEVLQLRMGLAVVARELAEHTRVYEEAIQQLTARIDGASAWCEQNERALNETRRHTEDILNAIVQENTRLDRAGVLARLRWILFGTRPTFVNPMDAVLREWQARAVPESQVVIE